MVLRGISCFLKLSKLSPNKPFLYRTDALRFKATNSYSRILNKKLDFERTSNSFEHTARLEDDSVKRHSSNTAFKNLLRGLGESTSTMKPAGVNIPDVTWDTSDAKSSIPDEQTRDESKSTMKRWRGKRNILEVIMDTSSDAQERDDHFEDSEEDELTKPATIYRNIMNSEVLEKEKCDWVKLSSLFSEIEEQASNQGSWTTIAMQALSSTPSQSEKALSLMEYIRGTRTPSIVDISFLMKTLGAEGFDSKYDETIMKLYDELKTLTDTFESKTGIAAIRGISKTTRWKESFDILTDVEIMCESFDGQISVAEAAFHYGDYETGFHLMEKIENKKKPVHLDLPFLKILENEKRGDSDGQMGTLLNFLKDYNVIPSEKLANEIGDVICRYDFLLEFVVKSHW